MWPEAGSFQLELEETGLGFFPIEGAGTWGFFPPL